MPTTLPIWDQRMLLLMKHCIDLDLCENQKQFLQSIGFSPTALRQVKTGQQSFRHEQIVKACKLYKISIAWVFGFSQEMKYIPSKSAIRNLKDAVRAIEAEMR